MVISKRETERRVFPTKQRQKGFTLIELIVVIAVLAIIAALTISSFKGLRENAQKEVCYANQDSLYRVIKAGLAQDSGSFDLEKTLSEQGLTGNADDCKGFSPADGSYTIKVDAATEKVTIRCSIHGGESEAATSIGRDVAAMILSACKNTGVKLTGFIDSNAVDVDGSVAAKRTAVENGLNLLGFSTEGVTWNISGTNLNNAVISWSEGKLTDDMYGKDTVAIRYDSAKKTYTVVQMMVVKPADRVNGGGTSGRDYPSNNYLVLDGTGKKGAVTDYVLSDGSIQSGNTSFDAAYAYYLQAKDDFAAKNS